VVLLDSDLGGQGHKRPSGNCGDLEQVLAIVTEPDHSEPDPRVRRRRYYHRRVGPSRWNLSLCRDFIARGAPGLDAVSGLGFPLWETPL
jgi:hypothetical protein